MAFRRSEKRLWKWSFCPFYCPYFTLFEPPAFTTPCQTAHYQSIEKKGVFAPTENLFQNTPVFCIDRHQFFNIFIFGIAKRCFFCRMVTPEHLHQSFPVVTYANKYCSSPIGKPSSRNKNIPNAGMVFLQRQPWAVLCVKNKPTTEIRSHLPFLDYGFP